MAQSLKQYKSANKRLSRKRLNSSDYPSDLVIVAEGDSWFDYPLKKDVLDYLIQAGYAIKKFSKYGDTLDKIAFGTDYTKKGDKVSHKGPVSLHVVLEAIKKYKPSFFLFSAGGNDIVGSEIVNYLNHANSKPKSLLNKGIMKEKLAQMKQAIEYYIKRVHRINKNCHILMDGYAYPKINGKGYKFTGIKLSGPWILPGMGQKAITRKKDQEAIVKELVDGFNKILRELSIEYSYFHHVDIRDKFANDKDWHNEIHLNNRAYKQLAEIYSRRMTEILNYDPTEVNAEHLIV